jgi:hypothetical protein
MTDGGLTVSVSGELRENVANSTLVIQITNNTQFPNPSFFITFPSQLFAGNVGGFQVVDSKDGKVRLSGQASQTTNGVAQPDNSTKWLIRLPRNANFGHGQEIGLRLNFKTRAAGTFGITIEWDLGEGDKKAKGAQPLDVLVLKSGESPDILNFAYKLTSDWTGAYARLDWETDSDSTVRIYRGHQQVSPGTLPAKMQGWPQDGLKVESGLEVFRLDATNKASSRTVSRWQFVSRRAGWNREYGFGELLCTVNDSDNTLYGVLPIEGGKAALRKFTVGIDDLGDLADDFNVVVPDTTRTSPGAFFQNAIWLVGGSQVDPAACSSEIWCYRPFEKEAHRFNANWPARMGHALVVFQNRLWILGGLDANGNALDDVWFYEGTDTFNQPPKAGLTWTSGKTLPKPICQPSVAAFTDGAGSSRKERLWLTGGVDAPWGMPKDETYCLEVAAQNPRDGSWHQVKGLGGAAWAGRLFANALCVGQSQGKSVLYELVTTKSNVDEVSTFESSMFQIVRDPTSWEATAKDLYKSIDVEKRWPIEVGPDRPIEPFRLTAVSFKNFVVVYSLFYGASRPYFAYLLS